MLIMSSLQTLRWCHLQVDGAIWTYSVTLVGQEDHVVDKHADLGEADQQHEDGGRAAAVLVHIAQLGGPLLAPGGQSDAHRCLVDGGPGAVTHPGLPEAPGHLLGQDSQLLQSQPPVKIALRPGQQESGTGNCFKTLHILSSSS